MTLTFKTYHVIYFFCLLIDYFNELPKPEESSLHANGIHPMICCPVKDKCFLNTLCDFELLKNISRQIKTKLDNCCNSGTCKYHYDGIYFKKTDCDPVFEEDCYIEGLLNDISIGDFPKVMMMFIHILFRVN